MKTIGSMAIPPKGTYAREIYEKIVSSRMEDTAIKKKIDKIIKKAYALLEIQQKNGSELPIDKQIREFNLEYNGRIFNGGLYDMPTSFNVVEAFNQFIPETSTFKIRDELDYIFSFDDFIDYITANNVKDEFEFLEERKIYSFTSDDISNQIDFTTSNKKKYEFSAISMIKFGKEVSIILFAGQKCNIEEETVKIKKTFLDKFNYEIAPGREHIQPDKKRELRAEPLYEGDNSLWKTIILVRFDLKTKTIDARYVLQDHGKSYVIITDNVDSYLNNDGEFINDKFKSAYENNRKKIESYSALFELCKNCLLIPSYMKKFEDDIVIERHPTQYLEFQKQLKNRKIISEVDSKYLISYRNISRIPSRNKQSSEDIVLLSPDYKIETSGYWKKLDHRGVGRDKNGQPIHGRTWINQTLSWFEEKEENNYLNVKRENINKNQGTIYIMRSAAHDKNIFKIGLTKRNTTIRALELSRTTSSPDKFLIAHERETKDCILAEKLIHEKLSAYRINPKREYFKMPYSEILSVVESVINNIENINT